MMLEEKSYCNTRFAAINMDTVATQNLLVGNIFSLKFILKIQLRNIKTPKYCHKDLFTAASDLGLQFKQLLNCGWSLLWMISESAS